MQEFPGPRIRQTFILEQIDNPNRLCDTINLRVKLRLVDKPDVQVSVGGQIITNLRYTNDTTLVARTSEELMELMKRVKAVTTVNGCPASPPLMLKGGLPTNFAVLMISRRL